jgi:hypothetical protein
MTAIAVVAMEPQWIEDDAVRLLVQTLEKNTLTMAKLLRRRAKKSFHFDLLCNRAFLLANPTKTIPPSPSYSVYSIMV